MKQWIATKAWAIYVSLHAVRFNCLSSTGCAEEQETNQKKKRTTYPRFTTPSERERERDSRVILINGDPGAEQWMCLGQCDSQYKLGNAKIAFYIYILIYITLPWKISNISREGGHVRQRLKKGKNSYLKEIHVIILDLNGPPHKHLTADQNTNLSSYCVTNLDFNITTSVNGWEKPNTKITHIECIKQRLHNYCSVKVPNRF